MKTLSIALILLATVACVNADDSATNSKLEGYFSPSEISVGEVGVGSGEVGSSTTSLTAKSFNPNPFNNLDLTLSDLNYAKRICFRVPNDIRRCVSTKWLYMMLVLMEAEDD